MNDIESLEAEIAALYEKEAELKRELAQRKQEAELRKPVTITYKLLRKDPLWIGVELSQYRQDIVSALKAYPTQRYDFSTRINSLPYLDYSDFRKREFPSVTSVDDPQIELAYREANDPTRYIVEGSPKGYYVQVKKGSATHLLHGIQSVAYTNTYNQFLVAKSEGWRLFQFLTALPEQEVKYQGNERKELQHQWEQRQEVIQLSTLENVEYPVDIKGTLKPFQNVTSYFTEQARRSINANEMGLGKSLTSIAVSVKNNFRTLIVCPASLMLNWDAEVKKWTDQVPYIIQSTTPDDHHYVAMLVTKPQFVIINYESLSRFIKVKDEQGTTFEKNLWIDLLNSAEFDRIVVDEAHYIKNIEAARSKAVRKLQSPHLTLLTGTPVQNRPAELFPMLNMIDPITFNSRTGFLRTYSDGKNGVRNSQQLRELLAPIMFRKTKKDVMSELEPITRSNHYYELTSEARKRYQRVIDGIYEHVRSGQEYNVTSILAEFIRLKQICSEAAITNAIALIEDTLEDNAGNDYNKIILFSQFKDTVNEIYTAFRDRAVIITGDYSQADRMQSVERFQQDEQIQLACCTTQVAGEGLNMTAAGTVIFTDLMWTPARHQQAEARAYGRLADAHSINSIYMIAQRTIMEYINQVNQEKLNMIEEIVEGESAAVHGAVQHLLAEFGA